VKAFFHDWTTWSFSREPLKDLARIAERLGVSEAALRQRFHRGESIAEKRGKKLFSHLDLAF
jgi:hypothetical protein